MELRCTENADAQEDAAMSTKTPIEWTDVSWNPLRGCSLVSKGCESCYAMKMAHRFSGKGQPYAGLTEIGQQGPRWNGTIRLVPEALEEPLHWKQPRRVFVNSMSDLFHADVPAEFIVRVFEVMDACPQHTFQILTKRPERVESVLYGEEGGFYLGGGDWMPNVWMGFSAEDQTTFDRRLEVFALRPGERIHWAYAMKLWCSLEPLLGPIDIRKPFPLQWVVCGGESGPHARPCDLAWMRSIKEQCQDAAVPVFVKQLGARWYDTAAGVGIRGSVAVPIDKRWTWVTQRDRKGGDFDDAEFPVDLRVRQFPKS